MKLVGNIHQDEDGVFIAECPSIPGCVSQGNTQAEAEKNIADAIRECTAALELSNLSIVGPSATF